MTAKPPRSFLPAALVLLAAAAPAAAQDGPLRKAGRALDSVGKSIRRDVEDAVARGQITAQERDLMDRITGRLRWDKRLTSSALSLEVLADGTAVLRGSVADDAAKARAVDLVESTVGVTRVVDEIAVARGVRVIETKPADPTRVIVVTPPAAPEPLPTESKVIIRP